MVFFVLFVDLRVFVVALMLAKYMAKLSAGSGRLQTAERDDEHVAMARTQGIQGRDRRHAVSDARIVDERGIERIGEREAAKRTAVEVVHGRRAADDLLPIDEQDEDVVDAVAVNAFGRRTAGRVGAR